jgi:hypothetical protein
LKRRHAHLRRQKKHVAFSNGMGHASVYDLTGAINAHEYARFALGAHRERRLPI